ncbi:hypothetical protein [Flavobacterium laiguense]|uniref:Uncharacterized protein n=1 Tax=Flavobacterium laiguense TaxID=2169409 RepID=A0A2U1JSH2_9FLAO|nr:hypothetical protein [Flavobacterium laiguense]PWA08062.1 hypothetical protein DB891_12755 [Flavobacterium laiguense]
MNRNLKSIAFLFLGTIAMVSCTNDNITDDNEIPNIPATATELKEVRTEALTKLKQTFTITEASGSVTLTSEKGVKLMINRDYLRKNGIAVTGPINIEYVELFDKGHMLVANKPTMGLTTDGKKNLLISGGEFYIKATQDGVALESVATMTLLVPASLTDGIKTGMTLWLGNLEDPENLVWKNIADAAGTNGGKGGVQGEGNNYYVSFGTFGWTNVDKFYSDPRPKTTILVDAPEGYDNKNSAIYLSYDGEGKNALAKLDTYTTAGLFSEHYGQIPIGLACHIIFATEDNGQWRWAIKAVTVAANDVYTFTLAETTVGTEAQLIAAINAIQ